ncbi:hypothetical protein ABTH88_22550, partial [Acinetobacter baumannii]
YRDHVKWFVQNLPECGIAAWCTEALLPEEDLGLFSDLTKLWQENVEQAPNELNVLFNSSIFFETAGKYDVALKLGLAAG